MFSLVLVNGILHIVYQGQPGSCLYGFFGDRGGGGGEESMFFLVYYIPCSVIFTCLARFCLTYYKFG